MSCCNNKRRKYKADLRNSNSESRIEPSEINHRIDKANKVFEYIGSNSLRISGAYSNQVYYFRFKGHRVEVQHNDAHAMMGESYLKVIL